MGDDSPRAPGPTSVFGRELARRSRRPSGEHERSWWYVPYDQLADDFGPLSREDPRRVGIVLVESRWRARRRPVHRAKLALLLANQRHFALEQAERGVAVRYLAGDAPIAAQLAVVAAEVGPLAVQRPAERELRVHLTPLIDAGDLREVAHEGWLTTSEEFERACGATPPWRMDRFYRAVRRRSGWLMDDGKPRGGRYSFDAQNRRPWQGDPPAPQPPRFAADAITGEVIDLVENRFADHPGTIDPALLVASRAQVEALWSWAKSECLPWFGPYEDAMSERSSGLFHTRIAPLINLGRLSPRRVVEEALALDLPIESSEGFLRQILGWREFAHHVHEATDGLRTLAVPVERAPADDGGYLRWRGLPFTSSLDEGAPRGADARGARPSYLGAERPLPPAYWGAPSGLRCLDETVRDVWREGWSHHITRLMVLANVATLLDVSPRELTDWFWVAYVDAYDWVVEPNVLGMGTFAAGDAMTTKPYVSGAGYVARMSDHCASCAFDPRTDCPLTPLYWAFLARHEERLSGIERMRLPIASLRKRSAAAKRRDRETFERLSAELTAGRFVAPTDAPRAKGGAQ